MVGNPSLLWVTLHGMSCLRLAFQQKRGYSTVRLLYLIARATFVALAHFQYGQMALSLRTIYIQVRTTSRLDAL